MFRQEVQFDGGDEIEKVGQEQTDGYLDNLQRAYYQDELVTQLYHLLFKKENIPVVLVGKEGTGKHTVMDEVVYRYMDTRPETADYWKRHYVWHINPNRIIAGNEHCGALGKTVRSDFELCHEPYWQGKNFPILF